MLAMLALAGEEMSARLTARMREAGVDALVIKGVATERWLYGQTDPRPSIDVDLLVAPAQVRAAESVLMERGFVSRFDGHAPEWADQHGHAWLSAGDLLPVDLHRRIWGCTADPERVWDLLWQDRETIRLVPGAIEVPGVVARTMMAATHASQHAERSPQALADLRRALQVEPPETWRDALALAEQCGATAALAAGLGLVPEGAAVLHALDLLAPAQTDLPEPPEIEHLTTGEEGVLRLTRAAGLGERTRIAWREVFPSVTFMRLMSKQSGLARRGSGGLVAAYLARWGYIGRGLLRARRDHRAHPPAPPEPGAERHGR
jgi:hypothetical protein